MSYKHTAEKIADYRRQIRELREKMRDVQAAVEPEEVKDYTFQRADGGSVRLSELFGDKADLFVIHNMGARCPYCTLWADGFNGAYEHLRNRAAFVVSSPDAPEQQRKFAASRGWRFPMVSCQGTTFAEDMGYRQDGSRCRACRCSSGREARSCAWRIPRSRPATISAASGTCSISSRKARAAGSRNSVIPISPFCGFLARDQSRQ